MRNTDERTWLVGHSVGNLPDKASTSIPGARHSVCPRLYPCESNYIWLSWHPTEVLWGEIFPRSLAPWDHPEIKRPVLEMIKARLGLEKFTLILPVGCMHWVFKHQPESLANAVWLMENYLAAEMGLAASHKLLLEAKGATQLKGEHNQRNWWSDSVVSEALASKAMSTSQLDACRGNLPLCGVLEPRL